MDQGKEAESNSKQYDLKVILSVTTEHLLTDMGSIYAILNYLTGEPIYTHQIPMAMRASSRHILKTYPKLSEAVLEDGQIKNTEDVEKFVAKHKTKYGTDPQLV